MGRKIGKGGTRGSVFRAVARERLLDARVLLKENRFGGAAYLVGYALECILKWAVTQRTGAQYLAADLETHDLDLLLLRAGLDKLLATNTRLEGIYAVILERWTPELRYTCKQLTRFEMRVLYDGMIELYDWVQEQVL